MIGLVLRIAILCFIPNIAHAYIDPGTGSMLFQLVIASVIGALVTISQFWTRISTWVSSKKKNLLLSVSKKHTKESNSPSPK